LFFLINLIFEIILRDISKNLNGRYFRGILA
jgi:hypothetical protein